MDTQEQARMSTVHATRVVLVLAVAFLLFVSYGLIDNRWYHIITINGGSMEPAISSGDAIVIVRPPARLKPGMIVTLQVGENVVTHRVKTVAPDGTFTTAGDANPTRDDWSGTKVRVVGVCIGRIPVLGRLLDGLSEVARSGAYYTSRRAAGASVIAAEEALIAEEPPLGATDAVGEQESAPPGDAEESLVETPGIEP